MSEPENVPGLPDDVQALLKAAESGAPLPPPGMEAAILAKVTATVAAPAAAAAAAGMSSAPPVAIAAKPLLAFALATVVGGGLYLANSRPAADVRLSEPVSVPACPPACVSPPSDAPDPAPEAAPPVTAPVEAAPIEAAPVEAAPVGREPPPIDKPAPGPERAVPTVPTVPTVAADPAREAALLEGARDALSRGDGDVALKKLQEHAGAFPRGKLVEERRALTVVAYAQRGDLARARAAARAFEREYPSSLFLETVRAATEESP